MIRGFAIPIAGLLISLAGCTAGATPTSSHDDPTQPQSITTQPVEIPDGVVATGTLRLVSGERLGDVQIIKDGYDYRIVVPDPLDPIDPRVEMVVLSDSPFEKTECGDANIWQIGFGDEATREEGLPANAFPSGDWSFLTALLVVGYPDSELGGDAAGCMQPILATALLSWDVPDVRPWVDPVDSGATAGATGDVDGTLYTTAPGDVWDEIAARFGIGRDDLEWLNPIRSPSANHTAFADQVLNLDPDDRSDSESRRPQ
jgi:hypothetical protein